MPAISLSKSIDWLFNKIMPGTSSHAVVRLSRKGMKRVSHTGYGDHYVHVKIQVPKSLSAKQKALIYAYAELEEDTPGQILGVSYDRDGKKVSVAEPHNLVDSVKEALKEKKSIEATADEEPVEQSKRSKG